MRYKDSPVKSMTATYIHIHLYAEITLENIDPCSLVFDFI